MIIVDVVYFAHHEFEHTEQVLKKHTTSFGYIPYLPKEVKVHLIKHFKQKAVDHFLGAPVVFFKRRNSFWQIPFSTHRYIKKVNPDIVIVEGLIFPLQTIFLKLLLPAHCVIVAQHHGETPFKGIKRVIQKIANRCINAYLFTAKDNAQPWIQQRIIDSSDKCFELLEASTYIQPINKAAARLELGITGSHVFLWVGRLNENKDPLTILQAFELLNKQEVDFTLFMIYQTNELLLEVESFLKSRPSLSLKIKLVGEVPKELISHWYSAADFYISGSHHEGSGYAVLEAIACGCVPIITRIPSFVKMTEAGNFALFFSPGNVEELYQVLTQAGQIDIPTKSSEAKSHFNHHLSFNGIAVQLQLICEAVIRKKVADFSYHIADGSGEY